jgi:HlyD family secretion protein
MSTLRCRWYRWLGVAALAMLLGSPWVSVSAEGLKARETPAPTFRTAAVTRGDLVVTVGATGTVEPENMVDVSASVVGTIEKLGPDPRAKTDPAYRGKSIDYGSPVEEGTVLAQINDLFYAAQVEQVRAGCLRAEAELAQAKAKLELAEAQWRRAQDRAKSNAVPASDLEEAKLNGKVAQASVSMAEASLAQSRAVLKQAEINLAHTTIRSPLKGVIIDRRVSVGQMITASLSAPGLFLIASDLKKMEVWVSVHEADVARIRENQPVRFTVDAYPGRVFEGKVRQVRLNATMTQNVVTYTVVFATDNSDGKLLPYLTANVRFEVDRRKGVLLVPNAALRWQPQPEWIAPDARGKAAITPQKPAARADQSGEKAPQDRREQGRIWVQDGRYVRPIAVQIGPSNGTVTEVSGDVKEGLQVVVGASVAPTSAARESESASLVERVIVSLYCLRAVWGGAMPSQRATQKVLASMGTNLLLVQPGAASSGGVSFGSGRVLTLTPQDADEIARQCPAVIQVAPIVRLRGQVVFGNRNWVPWQISGTTPAFLTVRDWGEIAEGGEFTDADVGSAARVCLIGQTLKREVFQGQSPVGEELRIQNVPFRVIGVLAAKGTNLVGMDQDDIVLAPWTAIKRVAATQAADAPQSAQPLTVDQILARAASTEEIPEATGQITELLRQRHHIRPAQSDDFNIRDMTEITRTLARPFRL